MLCRGAAWTWRCCNWLQVVWCPRYSMHFRSAVYIYICVYDYISSRQSAEKTRKGNKYYIYICIYIQKYALHTLTLRAHVGHRVATVGASRKGGWGGSERVMWMLSGVRVPALGHNIASQLSECGFLFHVGLSAVISRDGLLTPASHVQGTRLGTSITSTQVQRQIYWRGC